MLPLHSWSRTCRGWLSHASMLPWVSRHNSQVMVKSDSGGCQPSGTVLLALSPAERPAIHATRRCARYWLWGLYIVNDLLLMGLSC